MGSHGLEAGEHVGCGLADSAGAARVASGDLHDCHFTFPQTAALTIVGVEEAAQLAGIERPHTSIYPQRSDRRRSDHMADALILGGTLCGFNRRIRLSQIHCTALAPNATV